MTGLWKRWCWAWLDMWHEAKWAVGCYRCWRSTQGHAFKLDTERASFTRYTCTRCEWFEYHYHPADEFEERWKRLHPKG